MLGAGGAADNCGVGLRRNTTRRRALLYSACIACWRGWEVSALAAGGAAATVAATRGCGALGGQPGRLCSRRDCVDGWYLGN